MRRGIDLYESIRPEIGLAEAEHEGTFGIYRSLIELHLYLSLDQDWLDEVFELIERSKARYWSETITPLAEYVAHERFRPEGIASATARNIFLISFFSGPNATFLMYGLNGQLSARRVDVGDEEMRELVQGMTFDLLATHSREGPNRANADRLSELLLRDLHPLGARAIHILPDGALWALPFDALTWGEEGAPLSAVAPVVTAPGIHIVRSMRARHPRSEPDRMPLVLARPEAGADVPDLPGAEEQAAVIKNLFPGCQVLTGARATRAAMLAAMPNATYIHIAAHAMARASEPPYILLCNGQGAPERVHIEDIVNTPLSAQLVFLAACSTSFGTTSSGEGLISIARAFLFAGARCVIGTLWPIPEDETVSLVSSFYHALARGQATIVEAMDAAKQTARNAGMSTRTWAAFQIVGDAFSDLDPIQSILDRKS